jgi:hypothetical protein
MMEVALRTLRCTAVLAACALGTAAPASAGPRAVNTTMRTAPASDLIKVEAVRRKHPRRAYIDVPVQPRPPGPAPECPGLTSWNPANPDRGYCDPGFAYHGNVNGCAIDLGYGRWGPCGTGR